MLFNTPTQGRAASLYMDLECRRSPFLSRGRDCSKYTIPALLPPDGHNGYNGLYQPFQSTGARCVNNLASKMMLALFPPTRRFFRLVLSDKLKKDLLPGEQSEIEVALTQIEQRVMTEMETLAVRSAFFEALRHLVVTGNALVHVGKPKARVFPLSQYVVRRDPEGTVLEIVIKESVDPSTLPDSTRGTVLAKQSASNNGKPPTQYADKFVDVYTHIYRDGKMWRVYQEVLGMTIPESVGHYGEKKLPWLVLRWTSIDGEDYGRSQCDDFIGDLIACETLSRSIIRAAAIAAKVVFLVKPNSLTSAKALCEAIEGDFVDGDREDVEALGVDKLQDFQIAKATLDDINGRLAFGFLLNSAIRRNAERVTAEEIHALTQELEDGLGGVFSVQSREFQLPVVEAVMSAMEAAGELPKLPKDGVRPTIVTGIDALGRSHELARLDAFVGGALQTFGPEVLRYVNMSDYLRRRAAGLDLDPAGLIRSEQEVQAEQKQAQMMQLAQAATPNAVKAVGDRMLASQQQQAPTQ